MPDSSSPPTPPIVGGCTCGGVRYQLIRAPLFINCCHCRWCQRETGASFALNAPIESDFITSLGVAPEPVEVPSPSGKGQRVMRCGQCRVALWSHYHAVGTRSERISFVRVGTLDEPDRFPPDIHIHTTSKQPWVTLPANTPAMAGHYSLRKYWSEASIQRWDAVFA